MSIQTKIGIILICGVLGFGIVNYGIQKFIVIPDFLSLEQTEAIEDINRVTEALHDKAAALNALCRICAASPEAFEIAAATAEDPIHTRFASSILSEIDIDLVYVCNQRGAIRWGRIFDPKAGRPAAPGESLPADILPDSLLKPLNKTSTDAGIRGVIVTGKGPMLLAAQPIRKGGDAGPVWGFLVMGQWLFDNRINALARQTRIRFTLHPVRTGAGARTRMAAEHSLAAGQPRYQTDLLNNGRFAIHTLLQDISGRPAVAVTADLPRRFIKKGYTAVRHGILSAVLFGLGLLLALMLVLKRSLLSPIAQLTDHAISIRNSGDFRKRLNLNRTDEIGILARTFDAMLDRIQQNAAELSLANRQLADDIEKRKKIAAALKESEERFRSVVEQAGDAVFLNDMNGRFRDANLVACKRLGYTKKELLCLSVFDIDPDADEREDKNLYWRYLAHDAPIIFESRHRCKDGNIFPVEVNLSPVQYGGEKLILAIARDITDRKQMEEHLRSIKKMEAITTLCAGFSHNFNNILSIIIGSTELAKNHISADNRARELLKIAESAGQRAKEIVWQLISFSQETRENPTPFNIRSTIVGTIEELSATIPANIGLKQVIDPDCHIMSGDREQIRQLLIHLWRNAVEAMRESGGELTIRLQKLQAAGVAAMPDAPAPAEIYVKLSVADTGCGIAAESIDRIFDPYYTTKGLIQGAGMGLSIVYGIVKSHGGAITVDSEPGRGTVINLIFPAVDKKNGE